MNATRLVVLVALALCAAPSLAAPPATSATDALAATAPPPTPRAPKTTAPTPLHTGLQAPDVAPLVQGVLADGVQVAVFAGCFLALDDNDTCIDIAGKARDGVVAPSAPLGRAIVKRVNGR